MNTGFKGLDKIIDLKNAQLYYDYDSWEYFEGDLEGKERILKGISSLMKDKIGIELFLKTYEYIQLEDKIKDDLRYFIDEGLELAGFSKEEIEKIKG